MYLEGIYEDEHDGEDSTRESLADQEDNAESSHHRPPSFKRTERIMGEPVSGGEWTFGTRRTTADSFPTPTVSSSGHAVNGKSPVREYLEWDANPNKLAQPVVVSRRSTDVTGEDGKVVGGRRE